jgi:hypothetical protein
MNWCFILKITDSSSILPGKLCAMIACIYCWRQSFIFSSLGVFDLEAINDIVLLGVNIVHCKTSLDSKLAFFSWLVDGTVQ